MHLAIMDPKEFCGLLQAVLPRPTALQRGLPRVAPWRNAGARRNVGVQNSTRGSRVEENTRLPRTPMSNVVRSSFQAASHELIAKLIKAGYLRPALRNDADAITTAIAQLKEDLRGGR